MKKSKKISIAIFGVILISALALGISFLTSDNSNDTKQDNYSKSAEQKTMLQYTSLNLTFDKPEKEEFECEITGNEEKYIAVDAYNEGDHYWLTVDSKKPTDKEKPIIKIFKETDGKKDVVKEYQISVEPVYRIEIDDVRLNKGVETEITLKNPYEKDYLLKYNKSILKIDQILYDGDLEYHAVTGKRKGKTKVKAYIEGTGEFIGSFTVTVGDYDAEIKEEYQNCKISFNRHIESLMLQGGYLDLSQAISNYHANSVYTAEIENPEIAGSKSFPFEGNYTNSNLAFDRIFSKNTGETKLTVFEQRGKKKVEIGKINLTVRQAKDSEVYASYRELDNDGIFYENFMTVGDSYDLKNAVVERYLNFGDEKYNFDDDEYVFTAKSSRPDIISVDKNGVCTCHSFYYADDKGGAPEISYKITFKDGSSAEGGGQFDIVDEDYF